jgi:hypothetical protein
MINKTRNMADMAGHRYMTVTRAHARGYTALSGSPAITAMGSFSTAFDLWLTERCVPAVDTVTPTRELFADWQVWAEQNQTRVGSVKRFALAVAGKGYEKVQTRTWRGFGGIALKDASRLTSTAESATPATADARPACILALDLGTTTGWALRSFDGLITSGTASFKPGRYDGGGMRYLRFTNWVTEIDRLSGPIEAIYFEEVRRHLGTDAAHVYGGLMASLTSWAELRGVPYQGVPVGTIKRHATGKGNAPKEAMIAAARSRGYSPADDNEADAIAILHWALETQGGVA